MISRFTAGLLLRAVCRGMPFSVGSCYVSLHTEDPGDHGSDEVLGGLYRRQSAVFAEPDGSLCALASELDFGGMPAVSVGYFGVWDSPDGGNFIWGGTLSPARELGDGDIVHIEAGGLVLLVEREA